MVDRRPLPDIKQVSAFTGLPIATLRDQRHQGVGIGGLAIKVGKHLRWRWEDIDRWLDEQAAAGRKGSAA